MLSKGVAAAFRRQGESAGAMRVCSGGAPIQHQASLVLVDAVSGCEV